MSASRRRELSDSARSTTGASRSAYQAYSGAPGVACPPRARAGAGRTAAPSRRGSRRRGRRGTSPAGSGAAASRPRGCRTRARRTRGPTAVSALSCRLASGRILGASLASHASNGGVVGAVGLPGQAHRLVGSRDAGADRPGPSTTSSSGRGRPARRRRRVRARSRAPRRASVRDVGAAGASATRSLRRRSTGAGAEPPLPFASPATIFITRSRRVRNWSRSKIGRTDSRSIGWRSRSPSSTSSSTSLTSRFSLRLRIGVVVLRRAGSARRRP